MIQMKKLYNLNLMKFVTFRTNVRGVKIRGVYDTQREAIM